MFSKALSSFTSSISSNYTISPQPTSTAGPWKIFDAKRKQTGKAVSVFVFDPKSLTPPGGSMMGGGRGPAASLKRAHDEVMVRLHKEASSLARLRHPSILELQEPVEETRSGGLMFATEPVTASLAGMLHEKDEQERAGGVGGRGSRYVVEEADGTRKRRELEIDELEIQKGLLQLGKGLEFLHESAGLVHANLTPEAVMINAKGDWKISGLAFCGPHESSTAAASLTAISLNEALNNDPRLPRNVQLNLDYTSPDFVLDNSLVASADMFSLGLLIISLYNNPHTSPLSSNGSLSTYKRFFATASTLPSQSNNFLVPASHPLPPRLGSELLPRLITRRPGQRLSAHQFQEASYFDNILVSTIRFLDALPAKTAQEKAAFMRGLPRIIPQFPKSVLEKKVLPALLDEMKDKELLALIFADVFAMVKAMPTGKRAFSTVVLPKLREVFIANRSQEKDPSKEAGLMVLLENMETAAVNCSGKEFREDILPIILLAMDSPTHALVDAALGTLPCVLPVLDFTTLKGDLFPAIAAVFAKTSSLAIKIKGLDAFYILCGGHLHTAADDLNTKDDDDLNGLGVPSSTSTSSSPAAILDKHTLQSQLVPLLKAIKTQEPGVMMSALRVFRQVGQVADTDFIAMELLPVLWRMSLGPLLDLRQFGAFMGVIKALGGKVERDRIRILGEMGGSATGGAGGAGVRRAGHTGSGVANGLTNGEEADFETLVSGRKSAAAVAATSNGDGDLMSDYGAPSPGLSGRTQAYQPSVSGTPTFSWQTSSPAQSIPQLSRQHPLRQQQQHPVAASNGIRAPQNLLAQPAISRTITPDQSLSSFAPLTPASQFSQPLQPSRVGGGTVMSATGSVVPLRPATTTNGYATPAAVVGGGGSGGGSSIDWSAASTASNSATAWGGQLYSQPQSGQRASNGGFGLPPPPMGPPVTGILRPPGNGQSSTPAGGGGGGLSKYESLL
ncbi:Protein kinase domain-containing protein ppk32 [Friedmanniomyces endolithicus]|uniref:Protein kinase domain-containing protein ppk32 n=1 Tax=Friedmanniomyces endolithicus TaxID=329885 RepID=A0AAN6F8F0_9PEZI|nr:Protein kinase domain-containing protein ppk32 [Friedmanniomyces endolithicus]KAK0275473.1 Protein kinase domain-containing protein ppk32 [Friedmanniomyces endolithicus]KAK0307305.1 Protein kinase domain-containing protein ppk32 [Friedmanniomyces endolithicus]KAK0979356.1 Protein kinase domain-containing protein ppk32 [Friedmanniomyces endolithicus]